MALDDVFSKIYLNPKSVTFFHSPKKQIASLTITNYSSETIIFKMKSTRPPVYRMNPVYGIVEPRKEVDVRLTCKGMVEKQPPQNDRFTVAIAVAPPVTEVHSARKLWEIHKAKNPSANEINKKRIHIEFLTEHTENSLDEKAQVVEDPDDDIIRAPRARIRKKSRGAVEDDVGYTLDKTDTTGPMKAAKASHVEENSFSGEEQSRSRSVIEDIRTPSHSDGRKRKSERKKHSKSSRLTKSEERITTKSSVFFPASNARSLHSAKVKLV
ncbi:hypothetical protein Aduo_004837 [Ancylostoma duodenale]